MENSIKQDIEVVTAQSCTNAIVKRKSFDIAWKNIFNILMVELSCYSKLYESEIT